MITSLQNEKVKLAKALQTTAKLRRKEGKIVLEGARLVRDALLAGHVPVFVLVSSGGTTLRSSPTAGGEWEHKPLPKTSPVYRGGSNTNVESHGQDQSVGDNLIELLRRAGVEPLLVDEAVMAHVSDTQQPQGIVAVFALPRVRVPERLQRVLILDAIRDPGNLGTILRTAAAAGVEAVLLSPTCVDPYNPKALRAGMGAHFRVAVAEMKWERITEVCKLNAVYIADGGGELRYDAVDWRQAWALVIGGEAHGAGDEARQLAQTRISIPMAADTESLNAAVATGVILFEAARQCTD